MGGSLSLTRRKWLEASHVWRQVEMTSGHRPAVCIEKSILLSNLPSPCKANLVER